ncbi:MAG: class I SAM-dependent methyltransferase, partial [Anaerolineae bacterium]
MSSMSQECRAGQNEDFNFVAFAADPAYREANRGLIARALALLPQRFFHVDVASGTGLVPQELSSLAAAQGKTGVIIGIDPDGFALENARRQTCAPPGFVIEFLQGFAQDMARLLAGRVPPEGVDYVSIHDAIHEIPGEDTKRDVLSAMGRILRPGGLLTYNSAFTTAAMEEGAMDWGRLKAKGMAILGGRRDRTLPAPKIHSPEQYRQMIVDAGLRVIHEAKHVVKMSRAAMEAIGRYPAFIEGAFGDMVGTEKIPLAEKSRAILSAIDSLGLVELPRVWHEIMA